MTKINLDEILPFVSRPTRYIGQELNAISEDKWGLSEHKKLVKIALTFPDVYEIGMSNLGLKILYAIINQRSDALAERVYSPWIDLEKLLRKEGIPIFSLESKRPLREFDIIGFSLHYELSYTNVLNILNLADIPLRSVDRDESYPLIIAGGPCCFNPEPLADFIDLFVLGDGEEIIGEIIDTYKNQKVQNCNNEIQNTKYEIRNKTDLLKKMSKLEGIYVPSFYEVKYNEDGTIASVQPKFDGIPKKIKKRIADLNKVDYSTKPVIPYMHVVHNRLLLEIMRGCARGCRFCQAGIIYRPVREKNIDNLLNLAKEGIKNTGYEEISLTSLSSTDYPEIERLISTLEKELESKKISISLPSLRPDNFSLDLAISLAKVKKTGLTFAPESGSQRMRNVINKNINEEDIITTIGKAYSSGWKLVKLYFMFGLPTENKEDIEEIVNIVKKIRSLYKKLNINITVSAFVPKPHTPFQWVGQDNIEILKRKKEYLIKKLPGSKKWHKVETSFLEAVFARGDRKLADVLEYAWQKGCRFDEWDECFRFDIWMDSFEKCKIDPYFYAERKREITEVLPWDHFDCGVTKEFLLSEYKKAFSEECSNWSAGDKKLVKTVKSDCRCSLNSNQKLLRQCLRVKYAKGYNLRFISHLELITTIIRALHRMNVSLVYSEGWTPHPKISLGPALPVGVSSEEEYFDVQLKKRYEIDEFVAKLNNNLPPAITILHAQEISVNAGSLVDIINYAEYEIVSPSKNLFATEHTNTAFSSAILSKDVSNKLNCDNKEYIWWNMNKQKFQNKIDEFLSSKEIIVDKQTKSGIKKLDIRSLVGGIEVKNCVRDRISLLLGLKMGEGQSIKPGVVIQKIFDLNDSDTKKLDIKRVKLEIKK